MAELEKYIISSPVVQKRACTSKGTMGRFTSTGGLVEITIMEQHTYIQTTCDTRKHHDIVYMCSRLYVP